MNCFQIVSLKYWTQHSESMYRSYSSCELLSDCIFEILNTAIIYFIRFHSLLWIAFRLYLWNIEHSRVWVCRLASGVVNCFQIVSLKYWTQQCLKWELNALCCELLSDCIFEILNTAGIINIRSAHLLWIAFRLYLWNIEHSLSYFTTRMPPVVNCF